MSGEFDNKLSDSYFQQALVFLDDYQWIFNFPVTHLLVLNVLKELPRKWKETLNSLSLDDMNSLPLGSIKEDWPDFLRQFCQDCHNLRFPASSKTPENTSPSEDKTTSIDESLDLTKNAVILKKHGVAAKKLMEVLKLTSCIHFECQKVGVTHVLDMGSGLGYLDHALHVSYGYRILGLETQATFVQTATKKQQKSCASESSVIFKQFHMAAGLTGVIQAEEEAKSWLEESRGPPKCGHEEMNQDLLASGGEPVAALVGLHTCGDLAASTLRLFTSSTLFSVLVLAPCCFHKIACIENLEDNSESFENFPTSCALNSAMGKVGGAKFLRRPFLRLASQRSALRWSQQTESEHKQHSKHVLARAVLQLYATTRGLEIRKTRRRALAKANLHSSGVNMVKHMMSRYQLLLNQVEPTEEISAQHLQNVTTLYAEHRHLCPLIEGLTALQTALQGVAERLVLADMQALLAERGASCTRVVALWDEARSPRARAILATRNPRSSAIPS